MFDNKLIHSFDGIFIVRYDLTNANLKTVWRAAYQLFAQLDRNVSVDDTVICNERGDVAETIVKKQPEVEIKTQYDDRQLFASHLPRAVQPSKHVRSYCSSQKDSRKYTYRMGINCSLSIKNRSNTILQKGSNTILRGLC